MISNSIKKKEMMYVTQKILLEVFETLDVELEERLNTLKDELLGALDARVLEIKEALKEERLEFESAQITKILPRLLHKHLQEFLDLKINLLKPVVMDDRLFTLVRKHGTD